MENKNYITLTAVILVSVCVGGVIGSKLTINAPIASNNSVTVEEKVTTLSEKTAPVVKKVPRVSTFFKGKLPSGWDIVEASDGGYYWRRPGGFISVFADDTIEEAIEAANRYYSSQIADELRTFHTVNNY